MNKVILWLVAIFLVGAVAVAEAQQAIGIPRIGFVSGSGDPKNPGFQIKAFREGLQNLGYVEGKNILVEYRYGEGKLDTLSTLAIELVRLKVDVIVVGAVPAIRAAKEATKTISIVMVTSVDPVAAGMIDSLARPGGNITGFTTLSRDLSGKRLELLKEVVPGLRRVAILWDVDGPAPAIAVKEYEAAASALKLQIQSLKIRGPKPDLDGAFQAATKERANALITIKNPLLLRYPKQIADLAVMSRLPAMHEGTQYVEFGGLMSYAADDAVQWRRSAIYVDKILKGAKPADLPVEQPTKFEFIINLKAAKQIGLTIPPNVLARADRVIK